jgi:hypothetical protein
VKQAARRKSLKIVEVQADVELGEGIFDRRVDGNASVDGRL